MILTTDFDSLDMFCTEYGSSVLVADVLKVHVVDGLGVTDDLKPFFNRRYLHDQWKGIKYDKWEMINGVLRARVDHGEQGADEWVEYGKKDMVAEIIRYEFVGNCWLVFEGVKHAKRTVAEYMPNGKEFTGSQVVEEIGSDSASSPIAKEYMLEGVLITSPGPGWMNWRISSRSFYIEILGPN